MAEAVSADQRGQPRISVPEPDNAADLLPTHLAPLHVAGFFRALGSALDCLGGVIVGVVGLPRDLRKASLGGVQHALDKLEADGSPALALQTDFGEKLSKAITEAGPPQWLQWILDYRNMLVHRGRRLEAATLVPQKPVILRSNGMPYGNRLASFSITIGIDWSNGRFCCKVA